MADDAALYTRMEVRLYEAEKKLAKFQADVDRNMSGIERSTKRAAKTMEASLSGSFQKIGGAMTAFVGGLVGGIAGAGLTGIISEFRGIASSVAEIGDAAKVAGVDVRSFQELKYVADQNRIGVDALTDGLKEMNLRADEFVISAGKAGSASEAFKRLGYDAVTLQEKLKKPSELFSEIIGKLSKFDEAAQIRIADEVFGGTGGERFVQLISQGEQGLRDTIRAANDLGIVMDEKLIQRADEVDRRFNQLSDTVGIRLKSAIVSAADSLAEFIDGWRAFEDQQSGTLQNQQADIAMRRLELENKILEAQGNGALNERNRNKAIGQYRIELEKLSAEDAKITEVLNGRTKPMARSGNDTWVPPNISTASGSSSSTQKAAERERQAVADLVSELEEELRLVNATDAERRAAHASRMAGAAATEQERQKIVALTDAIYQEERAEQIRNEAMEAYRELTRGAIDDILSGLDEGKNLWSSFADAAVSSLKRIGSAILDAGLNSLFSGSSSLFSGGSTSGGLLGGAIIPGILHSGGTAGRDGYGHGRAVSSSVFASARRYHTGGVAGLKAGEVPAILQRGEVVIPRNATTAATSQTSNDVTIKIDVSGARGNQEIMTMVQQGISQGLAQYDRKVLPDSIARVNRNPNRR